VFVNRAIARGRKARAAPCCSKLWPIAPNSPARTAQNLRLVKAPAIASMSAITGADQDGKTPYAPTPRWERTAKMAGETTDVTGRTPRLTTRRAPASASLRATTMATSRRRARATVAGLRKAR